MSYMTEAEAAVLDTYLPPGLTDDMRDVAFCLYEAVVQEDVRCGQTVPAADWLAQLRTWALMVCMQLQNLANRKGGYPIYLAKGVAVHLSARDRQMCAEFKGDYKALARKYKLTPMRVRQIVDALQREQFLLRQADLPGITD